MSQPNIVEGGLVVPPGSSVAIVASRFNHFIVDRLVDGAEDGRPGVTIVTRLRTRCGCSAA